MGFIVMEAILGVIGEIFLIEMTAVPGLVSLGVSSVERRVLLRYATASNGICSPFVT
jgi:hypothetical protein